MFVKKVRHIFNLNYYQEPGGVTSHKYKTQYMSNLKKIIQKSPQQCPLKLCHLKRFALNSMPYISNVKRRKKDEEATVKILIIFITFFAFSILHNPVPIIPNLS